MSQNLRNFTKALYGMDAVVQRVPVGTWDYPSPCEGWTAADVLVHQIAVLEGAAATVRSGEMTRPDAPKDLSDLVETWNATRDGVLAALDHKGALQQRGKFWFGEMTIDEFISIVQWDPLTHAWDVAVATGVEAQLDEDLVRQTFDTIAPMRDVMVKRGNIGESQIEIADDANIVDRYLGLVGRDPSWSV